MGEVNRSPQLYFHDSPPLHKFEGQPFNYQTPSKKGDSDEPPKIVDHDAVVNKLAKDSLNKFSGLSKKVDENFLENEFESELYRQ